MKRRTSRRHNIGTEQSLEPRVVMSATPMQVGINLDNVREYLPNWMFTDAFQHSRPWISHSYNASTRQFSFNDSTPVAVDEQGWPTQLASWTNASGQRIEQRIGTLMFREINGQYPAGVYRAEWDGSGDVAFGMDAREISRGLTPEGHHFALLNVLPGNQGIYLGINSLNPADPIRDVHVWMPDHNGQSFAGQRWQPGADFSPFHPLFKERLEEFGILRFMQTMETNTSDIRSWTDRREVTDARQSSGQRNSFANGLSVEYMVQLANELDADPWFNMPHMADDSYVSGFASYVREHLEPDRNVYVEWSNEIWNGAAGFEAAPWIASQLRLPENSGLTTWQYVARETARDFNLWTQAFGSQAGRVVRTVGGQSVNPWIAERIVENMNGRFDAITIAPYFGPSLAQRAAYTADTTVDQVLDDLRGNLVYATQSVLAHQRLADEYSRTLNRDIRLLAYEGGPHLNPTSPVHSNVLHQATKSPEMAELQRDYMQQINAGGLDSYVHYRFSDVDRPSQYGHFGVLTSPAQPLSEAHIYRELLDAADGTLFTDGPTLVTVNAADSLAFEAGRERAVFRFNRGGNLTQPLTVSYATSGTATSGSDFNALSGTVTFPANENTVYLPMIPVDDSLVEAQETVTIRLNPGAGYSLIGGTTGTATVSIVSNDLVTGAPTVSIVANDPVASEANRDPGVFVVSRANGDISRPLTVGLAYGYQTASAGDYDAISLRVDFAAGETTRTIVVRPVDDNLVENTENVILAINPNSALYRVGNPRATVNIIDNDTPLSVVSIAASDNSASESGRESGTFTVTRTGSSNGALTVGYSILGTAANGFDYDRISGTVTIPSGALSANITIRPIDERVPDIGENVTLRLINSPAYLVSPAVQSTIVISDDDIAGPNTPQPVLMVIADRDFYFREYSDPRLALEAAGVPVVVAAANRTPATPHLNTGYGIGNGTVTPDLTVAEADAANYSAIAFVGGWGASMYQYAFPGTYSNTIYNGTSSVRAAVNELINDFAAQDKYIAGICHGVSILAWARVNGQSPIEDHVVTTAHFNSPQNSIPEATLYRWHSEVNGATVYTGGVLGDAATRDDDVVVDGRVITAENFDSGTLFGRTIALQLLNGPAASAYGVRSEDSVAAEGSGDNAIIEIFRTGVIDYAQVVRFRTTGSAIAGQDYASLGDRVLFQPRQSTVAFTVAPTADTLDEEDEDLFFELLSDPSYSLDPLRSVIVSVLDQTL